MATNLLFSVANTTTQNPTASWADITLLTSGNVTVAGTGSVILLATSVSIDDVDTVDESIYIRFAMDSSAISNGPVSSTLTDNANESNTVTMVHAITGVAAGTHTFSVQFQDGQGSPTLSGVQQSSFQVIEIEGNASIPINLYSTAQDSPNTGYTDIVGLAGTFTPTASSLHLFITNLCPDDKVAAGNTQFADVQFEIGTTLSGPPSVLGINNTGEFHGTNITWAETGLAASSTDVAVRWRNINGTANQQPEFSASTPFVRTFQVVEITADFALEEITPLTSSQQAPASMALMTGMTDSITPNSTDSVILTLAHYVLDLSSATDEVADGRLYIDGALAGPMVRAYTDGVDEGIGRQHIWGVTGKSGAITNELHWDLISSTPNTNTSLARTFQIIDLQTAGGGGTTPKGPFGHPLHGPFAGPIGP